jgi:hypothetical protein
VEPKEVFFVLCDVEPKELCVYVCVCVHTLGKTEKKSLRR